MDHEPEDEAVYAAQAPVMQAAWDFASAYWIDRDMQATWRATHPTLRRCWAQMWMMPLLDNLRADGLDRDEVVEAFAEDAVDHPLWEPFARTQIQHADLPVDETWGAKVNPDVIAPNVMLVRLLPVPPSGAVQPGEVYAAVPLLMQYDEDAGWRLLNFMGEQTPEPGWPPNLGHTG